MLDHAQLSVQPLDAAVGAQVTGVDLSEPPDAETAAAITEALGIHGILVFPDQHLTPEQQVTFSRIFGPVEINHNAARYGLGGSPELYVISNVTVDGKPVGSARAGEEWHSDMCYARNPALATMLYAREVPVLHGLTLGDTGFANTAAAFDALPEEMKAFLRGKRAVFDFQGRKRPVKPSAEAIAQYPPVDHPIVRRHPRTGRESLYVNHDDCTGIVGMDDHAARNLINALSEHVVRPEFVYRHQWRVDQLVVWDNCTVQHKAILDYDQPQRRLLWRTTIRGPRPV